MDKDCADNTYSSMPEMTALGKFHICANSSSCKVSVEWFRILSRDTLATERMHSHTGIEIHFLLYGHHTFFSPDSMTLPVEAMKGIMVPSGCRHRLYNTGTHFVRYVLNFILEDGIEGELDGFLWQAFQGTDIRKFNITPDMVNLLHECAKEAEDTHNCFMILLESNILKILVLTARELNSHSLSEVCVPTQQRLPIRYIAEEALSYIEEHLSNSPSVGDVAQYIHISKRQLQRIFHSEFDCSVQQKIAQIRIRKAKELLTNTMLPIAEIALLVGYTSASSFSRFFTYIEGQSPFVYRNAALSHD